MRKILVLFALVVPGFAFAADWCVNGVDYTPYMLKCAKQMSDAAPVRQIEHKRALCAKNVKNKELTGIYAQGYMDGCMRRNDAQVAYEHYKS